MGFALVTVATPAAAYGVIVATPTLNLVAGTTSALKVLIPIVPSNEP